MDQHPVDSASARDGPKYTTRDILWTYRAAKLYELLVLERGRSATRYGTFIGQARIGALLEK